MKAIISSLLFWFIFAGFTASCNHQEYHLSRGEQLVNSILAKTAKMIKDKYNLKPCGSGASMPGGPIRELALCFDTKYPLTKEMLRELVIQTANELLNQVNDNREIQGFLKEFPFTIKNVQIIIYNHDKNGKSLMDPAISNAQILQGTLSYSTIDPQDTFRYKNEFVETYQEALHALKQ